MSNTARAFERGKALIVFITCGDPDFETTGAAVRAAAEGGADMIELGIPFSDPTAEGPVIQEANLRALSGGATTDSIFGFVKSLRAQIGVPLALSTYANVVFSYGAERFISTCREVGVDALIVTDLPFEERGEFAPICARHGVELISYVAPARAERIAAIAGAAEGFLYVVPAPGAGGAQRGVTYELDDIVNVIRRSTRVPCAIDCGVSTPEQARRASELSDGAIVGSALVELLARHGKAAPGYIAEYVKSLKAALE